MADKGGSLGENIGLLLAPNTMGAIQDYKLKKAESSQKLDQIDAFNNLLRGFDPQSGMTTGSAGALAAAQQPLPRPAQFTAGQDGQPDQITPQAPMPGVDSSALLKKFSDDSNMNMIRAVGPSALPGLMNRQIMASYVDQIPNLSQAQKIALLAGGDKSMEAFANSQFLKPKDRYEGNADTGVVDEASPGGPKIVLPGTPKAITGYQNGFTQPFLLTPGGGAPKPFGGPGPMTNPPLSDIGKLLSDATRSFGAIPRPPQAGSAPGQGVIPGLPAAIGPAISTALDKVAGPVAQYEAKYGPVPKGRTPEVGADGLVTGKLAKQEGFEEPLTTEQRQGIGYIKIMQQAEGDMNNVMKQMQAEAEKSAGKKLPPLPPPIADWTGWAQQAEAPEFLGHAGLPNALKSKYFQMYESAMNRYAAASLGQASPRSVNPERLQLEKENYFGKFGDAPQEITAKNAARAGALHARMQSLFATMPSDLNMDPGTAQDISNEAGASWNALTGQPNGAPSTAPKAAPKVIPTLPSDAVKQADGTYRSKSYPGKIIRPQ